MHYVLVGPGALGCLFACAALKGLKDGERFTILDHNRKRAEQITAAGVLYESDGKTASFAAESMATPETLGKVDVLIVCVKSYDLASCLLFCKPLLGANTLVVLMQNGISHLAFAGNCHGATVAFGTTTEGATRLGPGHVRHAGKGLTQFGFTAPVNEHCKQHLLKTKELFSRGGMETLITEDILAKLWAKLFVNVGINALTAILQCKNGEMLTIAGATGRMERAVMEAVEVARKKQIAIFGDPFEATKLVCGKTAANVSSMLQDVQGKRRTEIEAINGAVVNFAKEMGIETPENELLVQQVREIERTYRAHS